MYLRMLIFLFAGVIYFSSCSDDGGTVPLEPIAGTIAPNVGGPEQPNQVYVDLSTKAAIPVSRESWDFGFSNGTDFTVILNASNGMLAVQSAVSNFNEITSADTMGFLGSVMYTDAIFGILISQMLPPWFTSTAEWIDHPDGNLSKTAIGEVAAVAADNKVFIVNRGKNSDGSPRGFMKILTVRNGNAYDVTYGDLNDATGTKLTIAKNQEFNFSFLSFDAGLKVVEPMKDDWDLGFSTYSDYVLSNFSSGYPVPYTVNDFVFLNRSNVSVSTVIAAGDTKTEYDAFTNEDALGLTLVSEINAIGTSWRTVATPQIPGSLTAPVNDRFYVLRDADGIYYKMLFTQMTNLDGLRGFPEFIFEELK
jgi:hypothetical protein